VRILSFQEILESWPYDAEENVRVAFGEGRRKVILVRQPMGLEQYEMDHRPDGRRLDGKESLLDVQSARLQAGDRANAADGFKLNAKECAELFDEGLLYHSRASLLVRLKDWPRAERDTARNLRLIEFIKHHARSGEDSEPFEQWRPDVERINAYARAMSLLEQCRYREALATARNMPGWARSGTEPAPDCGRLAVVLQEQLRESLANYPTSRTSGVSQFVRQSDYWSIRHRGRTACLKATRGLHCLEQLLRHPGQEFHVSELLDSLAEPREAAPTLLANAGEELVAVGLYGGCPRLDAQAKIEYKRRLDEIRQEMSEAERCNDADRVARAREEMNVIVQHLASAVGLGGRDRKSSSEAERARSAVTKRIKQSIQKIGEAIPELGQHLAASIKTGYFCSYSPHQNRPVAWKF
jgi:hypothetical protein